MNKRIIDIVNTMELAADEQWLRDDPVLWARVLEQCDGNPVFILPDYTTPALVCGVVAEGDVGEVWMIRGAEFKGRVTGDVLRQQKTLCRMVYQAMSLREMCMGIWPHFEAGKRWAAKLGFVYDRMISSDAHNGKDVEVWVYQFHEKECHNGFS